MKWFDIFRIIMTLISAVEPLFGPKSGAVKKKVVTDIAKTVVEAVEANSTGGQANTWGKIKEPVGNIIDNTVEILFPK